MRAPPPEPGRQGGPAGGGGWRPGRVRRSRTRGRAGEGARPAECIRKPARGERGGAILAGGGCARLGEGARGGTAGAAPATVGNGVTGRGRRRRAPAAGRDLRSARSSAGRGG